MLKNFKGTLVAGIACFALVASVSAATSKTLTYNQEAMIESEFGPKWATKIECTAVKNTPTVKTTVSRKTSWFTWSEAAPVYKSFSGPGTEITYWQDQSDSSEKTKAVWKNTTTDSSITAGFSLYAQ